MLTKSSLDHGGAIAPGAGISLDALTNHGALLPSVDFKAPRKAIMTNTVDCIRSGVMFGTSCMLDGMIERFFEEAGSKCEIIATGGLAPMMIKNCKHNILSDEDIILEGLSLIYQKKTRTTRNELTMDNFPLKKVCTRPSRRASPKVGRL